MASNDETRLDQPDPPHARFVGGTLVLEGVARAIRPPAPFQWIDAIRRCPAVHYRIVRPWLKQQSIRNRIPRWRNLSLSLHDDREPHSYQIEALQAWLNADCWPPPEGGQRPGAHPAPIVRAAMRRHTPFPPACW